MATLLSSLSGCPAPFLDASRYPMDGGYLDGRYCSPAPNVGGGTSNCCLPCPVEDWIYPAYFNNLLGQVPNWIAVFSFALCVFLLLSFIILPKKFTHRHYLSIGLLIPVMFIALAFSIPLGTRKNSCYNAITPNDMYSSKSCAWTGALVVTGGLGATYWVFLRSLWLLVRIVFDREPGEIFFWVSCVSGVLVPGGIMAAVMTATGVSFRLGQTCLPNHNNAIYDFWIWLVVFSGSSFIMQLFTSGWAVRIYLRSVKVERRKQSMSNALSNAESASYTKHGGAVMTWRKMQRLFILQWRNIVLSMFVIIESLYFTIVFWAQDTKLGTVSTDPADEANSKKWGACLVLTGGNKEKCMQYAQTLMVPKETVLASLILASLVGLEAVLFLFRGSFITGYKELVLGGASALGAALGLNKRHSTDLTGFSAPQDNEKEELHPGLSQMAVARMSTPNVGVAAYARSPSPQPPRPQSKRISSFRESLPELSDRAPTPLMVTNAGPLLEHEKTSLDITDDTPGAAITANRALPAPQSPRLLEVKIEEPALYGLAAPPNPDLPSRMSWGTTGSSHKDSTSAPSERSGDAIINVNRLSGGSQPDSAGSYSGSAFQVQSPRATAPSEGQKLLHDDLWENKAFSTAADTIASSTERPKSQILDALAVAGIPSIIIRQPSVRKPADKSAQADKDLPAESKSPTRVHTPPHVAPSSDTPPPLPKSPTTSVYSPANRSSLPQWARNSADEERAAASPRLDENPLLMNPVTQLTEASIANDDAATQPAASDEIPAKPTPTPSNTPADVTAAESKPIPRIPRPLSKSTKEDTAQAAYRTSRRSWWGLGTKGSSTSAIEAKAAEAQRPQKEECPAVVVSALAQKRLSKRLSQQQAAQQQVKTMPAADEGVRKASGEATARDTAADGVTIGETAPAPAPKEPKGKERAIASSDSAAASETEETERSGSGLGRKSMGPGDSAWI